MQCVRPHAQGAHVANTVNTRNALRCMLQGQLTSLQSYIQRLEQQPAFQQGLEQALGQEAKQALASAFTTRASSQIPRLPIKGTIAPHQ